jgi:hypothetical protein
MEAEVPKTPKLDLTSFDGPDWSIRWPPELLIDELIQLKTQLELVERVLREAFVGSHPGDE